MENTIRFHNVCFDILELLRELDSLTDDPKIKEPSRQFGELLSDEINPPRYSLESLYGKKGLKELLRMKKLREKRHKEYARAVKRMYKDHLHEYVDVNKRSELLSR